MPNIIEQTTYEAPTGQRYRLTIEYDDAAENPRSTQDNITTLVTFDRDYFSPDSPGLLHWMPSRYCDTDNATGPYDLRGAREYAALTPDILALAGIQRVPDGTLRVAQDCDDWAAGYALITRDSWELMMGDAPIEGGPWPLTSKGEPDPDCTEGNRTPSAMEVITQDVEEYNRWARGEYFEVVAEKQQHWLAIEADGTPGVKTMTTWEHVDSLGTIDSIETAREEGLAMLPTDVRAI